MADMLQERMYVCMYTRTLICLDLHTMGTPRKLSRTTLAGSHLSQLSPVSRSLYITIIAHWLRLFRSRQYL